MFCKKTLYIFVLLFAPMSFTHSLAAEFSNLGSLPGAVTPPYTLASDISGDGTVVVGFSETVAGFEAFRWTASGGMVGLGDLPGGNFSSQARGANGDGSVIVGNSSSAAGTEAYRWTASGGMVGLGFLMGGASSGAAATNRDGTVVVGQSGLTGGHGAYRWTASGGMVALGDFPGGAISGGAHGVSDDGNVVVGWSFSAAGREAFRWTAAGGMVSIVDLPGGTVDGTAEAISGDGMTIVGQGTTAAGREAFRWTEASGMTSLGDLPGGAVHAFAKDVNQNGTVVVGGGATDAGFEPFRWTEADGMKSLADILAEEGITLTGWSDYYAMGVSDDGTVLVGLGDTGSGTESWIARADVEVGSGLISYDDLVSSLGSVAAIPLIDIAVGSLILNGAHGRPLARRVDAGEKLFWVAGDWALDDHNKRDGDIGLVEVGGGYNFGPLQATLSLGQTWAEQDLPLGGDIDADGTYLMAELLAPVYGTLWATFGGYWQWGETDIRRSYLNAGSPDSSKGNSDTRTWALRARLEWDRGAQLGKLGLSPYGELSYLDTKMDGYSETEGGFPVTFADRNEEATEVRLGVNGDLPLSTTTSLLGLLEGVHRFDGDGARMSGQVIGLFPFDFAGVDYDQDWLRAGIGIETNLQQGTFSMMLNGTTEGEDPNAWLAVSYQITF